MALDNVKVIPVEKAAEGLDSLIWAISILDKGLSPSFRPLTLTIFILLSLITYIPPSGAIATSEAPPTSLTTSNPSLNNSFCLDMLVKYVNNVFTFNPVFPKLKSVSNKEFPNILESLTNFCISLLKAFCANSFIMLSDSNSLSLDDESEEEAEASPPDVSDKVICCGV